MSWPSEMREFLQVCDKLENVMRTYPREVGRIAVNFSKERFRAQNWVNHTTDPWKPRRRPGKDRYSGILIGKGSGALKRSIRVITANENYVLIGTDKEYARTHNEGAVIEVTEQMRKYYWAMYYKSLGGRRQTKKGEISNSARNRALNEEAAFWKSLALAKKIRIPKRKFLGESVILAKQIEREMLAKTMRALQNKEL